MAQLAARRKPSDHFGVQIGNSGLRLDLFDYPVGVPVAAKHPHIGLAVAPEWFPGWRQRLLAHGVPLVGPRRLGPPGQASIYSNDPFGNHLEIHTDGVDTEDMPFGGPPETTVLTYRLPR
jgi:catechol 2,3-dioxygenase-like lactoylglutathione lyase family enzyme